MLIRRVVSVNYRMRTGLHKSGKSFFRRGTWTESIQTSSVKRCQFSNLKHKRCHSLYIYIFFFPLSPFLKLLNENALGQTTCQIVYSQNTSAVEWAPCTGRRLTATIPLMFMTSWYHNTSTKKIIWVELNYPCILLILSIFRNRHSLTSSIGPISYKYCFKSVVVGFIAKCFISWRGHVKTVLTTKCTA